MWKDIPQWEELYEVNDKGEVRNKKTSHLLMGDKIMPAIVEFVYIIAI